MHKIILQDIYCKTIPLIITDNLPTKTIVDTQEIQCWQYGILSRLDAASEGRKKYGRTAIRQLSSTKKSNNICLANDLS
jgi:hypothetical protein